MLNIWASQQQGSPGPLPDPIVISDFENGVYALNGVPKVFDDLWGENLDYAPFDPATLIPGVGIQWSGSAPDFNSICSKQALFDAVQPVAGKTYVIDYSLDQPGGFVPQINLNVIDLPTFNTEWFWWHRGKSTVFVQDSSYTNLAETTPSPVGMMRCAVNLGPNELVFSLNGAANVVSPNTPVINTNANTLAMDINAFFGSGGTAVATLRSLTIYPLRPAMALPGMSV